MTLPQTLLASTATLPPDLQDVVAQQPPNVDRRTGADLVTKHMFPVSHRTIEAWSVPSRVVNGRALIPTAALFQVAYEKLVAAPLVMGGRGRASKRKVV